MAVDQDPNQILIHFVSRFTDGVFNNLRISLESGLRFRMVMNAVSIWSSILLIINLFGNEGILIFKKTIFHETIKHIKYLGN